MAVLPWIVWPLAASGWVSGLALVIMLGHYILGFRTLLWTGWALTAGKGFVTAFYFRYLRFVGHSWSYYFKRKPSPVISLADDNSNDDKPPTSPLRTSGVSVVMPTVQPDSSFRRSLESICDNAPGRIFIVTVGDELQKVVEEAVRSFRSSSAVVADIDFQVSHTMEANKRAQISSVIPRLGTGIAWLADSTVIWPAQHLRKVLAAFAENPRVGLVGTAKRPELLESGSSWERYWSFLGAVYLERHNWEIGASMAFDGGAFIISGRSCGIRTSILKDPYFLRGYENERIRIPGFVRSTARVFGVRLEPEIGPLVADDDNYIKRWCDDQDIEIKFLDDVGVVQADSSPSCVVGIANLGTYPRFFDQCLRWARTTFRSNPRTLLSGREWLKHPWSMYSVQLATITSFALFWDSLLVYLYTQTSWFSKQGLAALVVWILFTKTVKLISLFRRSPKHIVFLPAYWLFAYYHSWIKLRAMLTFWNVEWAGRDLDKINRLAQKGELK